MKDLFTLEEWENSFKPIQDDDGSEIFFETYSKYINELMVEANKLSDIYGSEPYQHIWTRIDGSSGKLIILNGWHLCNRLDYCLTKLPWGNGSKDDKNVYLEVTYED